MSERLTDAQTLRSLRANVGTKSKIIASTRDLTAATGSVSYTGAGFRPSKVIAFGARDFSIGSFGFGDSGRVVRCVHNTGGGTAFYPSSALMLFETSSNQYQALGIDSFDSDGFTGTWTKVNSPTGIVTIFFLCLG